MMKLKDKETKEMDEIKEGYIVFCLLEIMSNVLTITGFTSITLIWIGPNDCSS